MLQAIGRLNLPISVQVGASALILMYCSSLNDGIVGVLITCAIVLLLLNMIEVLYIYILGCKVIYFSWRVTLILVY